MSNQKRVWIHFSKKQHHSGFLIYQKNGLSFQTLVLPKMWRWLEANVFDGAYNVEYDITPQDTNITLIVYEGDRYCFKCDETWAQFFDEMATHVFDTEAKQEKNSNNLDETEDVEASLFEKVVGCKQWKTNVHCSTATNPNADTLEQRFFSFFNLLLFSNKLDLKERLKGSAQDDFGFVIGEGENKDALRNLCVAQILVKEIETHFARIRLGYLRTTEKKGVIKGKIMGPSIGELMMTDTRVAQCVYDKFVSDIPLFRVLVTALERVSSGSCFPSYVLSIEFVQRLRKKAHMLRVELSHIRSYPLSVGAQQSRRLTLLRRDIMWTESLAMSKILLNNVPKDMKDSNQGSGGLLWKVDTAKMWENIVQQILEKADFEVIAQGGEYNKFLWQGLGKKLQPDIIANTANESYLFDAKYKTDSGKVPTLPSDNDRYQLFAYSHVFDKNIVGIVYPAKSFEEFKQVGEEHKRGDYAGNKPEVCVLKCYQIPFPHVDDVTSMTTWKSYLSNNAQRFTETI